MSDNAPDATPAELEAEEAQKRSLLMVSAPIIAITGTYVAKKALDVVYKRVTGHAPPNATDSRAPLSRVLIWSFTTAAAVAMVNVAVDRWVMPDPEHTA